MVATYIDKNPENLTFYTVVNREFLASLRQLKTFLHLAYVQTEKNTKISRFQSNLFSLVKFFVGQNFLSVLIFATYQLFCHLTDKIFIGNVLLKSVLRNMSEEKNQIKKIQNFVRNVSITN